MSLRQQGGSPHFRVCRVSRTLKLYPCGMRYLVGKGTAVGRSGFCTDDLGDGLTGPRMVVVADGGHRFAIGKFEVSQADIAPFCAHSGLCLSVAGGAQPATGNPGRSGRRGRNAEWLSQRSGYVYRLPTRAEWTYVARAGTPDPNRNCQVHLAGVSRGSQTVPVTSGAQNKLGLVNVFGNAREWVMDGDKPVAMGGSYADPISACDVDSSQTVADTGDPATGFRLVREVP